MSTSSSHGIPTNPDGTPRFNPDICPDGNLLYVAGSLDDDVNDERGSGQLLQVMVTGPDGTDSVEGRFIERTYILGGGLGSVGAGKGDWASYSSYAPASAPSSTAGTGNCNKTPVNRIVLKNYAGAFQLGEVVSGGNNSYVGQVASIKGTRMVVAGVNGDYEVDETLTGATSGATGDVRRVQSLNMLTPAPLNDGDWTYDGSKLEVGEINKDLTPVPNPSKAGYFNWDPAASPSITLVDNPAAPDGSYDLYDQDVNLSQQANRIGLMGIDGRVSPDTIRARSLLPHWKVKVTVYRALAGEVTATAYLVVGRETTAE